MFDEAHRTLRDERRSAGSDDRAVGKRTLVERDQLLLDDVRSEYLWEDIPSDEAFQADAARASTDEPDHDVPAHEHEHHRDDDQEAAHAAQAEGAAAGVEHADPPAAPANGSGKRFSIADPFILVDGKLWYAYGTGLTVSSSKDQGRTWTRHGHMTAFANSGRRWAPEVHKIGASYVAYMAISLSEKQPLRIYVATSDHPVHGWTRPKVIARSARWSDIDPTFFTDPKTHKNYLLWKEDRTTSRGRKRIVMQQLDKTGTHLRHARKRTLLTAGVGAHSQWERRPAPRAPNWSVEAPTLEYHGGKYWLFYSGAGYEPGGGYAVGAASAASITGPFHREAHPILRGTSTMREPGHQSVIKVVIDGVTRWLLFFHARGAHGKTRYLREDEIVWANGRPHVRRLKP